MSGLPVRNKASEIVSIHHVFNYSDTCVLSPVQQENVRYIVEWIALSHRLFRATGGTHAVLALIRIHSGLAPLGYYMAKMGSDVGVGVGVWVAENESKLVGLKWGD